MVAVVVETGLHLRLPYLAAAVVVEPHALRLGMPPLILEARSLIRLVLLELPGPLAPERLAEMGVRAAAAHLAATSLRPYRRAMAAVGGLVALHLLRPLAVVAQGWLVLAETPLARLRERLVQMVDRLAALVLAL